MNLEKWISKKRLHLQKNQNQGAWDFSQAPLCITTPAMVAGVKRARNKRKNSKKIPLSLQKPLEKIVKIRYNSILV